MKFNTRNTTSLFATLTVVVFVVTASAAGKPLLAPEILPQDTEPTGAQPFAISSETIAQQQKVRPSGTQPRVNPNPSPNKAPSTSPNRVRIGTTSTQKPITPVVQDDILVAYLEEPAAPSTQDTVMAVQTTAAVRLADTAATPSQASVSLKKANHHSIKKEEKQERKNRRIAQKTAVKAAKIQRKEDKKNKRKNELPTSFRSGYRAASIELEARLP